MNRLVTLCFIIVLLGSCKTTTYVPVESVHSDTIYVSKVSRDSIHVQDSVFIHEKGDTVLIEKWRVKYVEKLLRDTCFKTRIDSVRVPYPVEKQLTRSQQVRIYIGGVAILLFGIMLMALILWLAAKAKKLL